MLVNKITKDEAKTFINHSIDFFSSFATCKEIFLVMKDGSWWRFYWDPISKDWLVKNFSNPKDKTPDVRVPTEILIDKIENIGDAKNLKAFQCKTSPSNIQLYKIIE